MRICASLFSLVLLAGIGCGPANQSLSLEDVKQPAKIVLAKQDGRGDTYRLSIAGSGKINGKATLSLILNEEPYKTEQLSGDVQFTWDSDWYADTAELIYTPADVADGSLELSYTFMDM